MITNEKVINFRAWDDELGVMRSLLPDDKLSSLHDTSTWHVMASTGLRDIDRKEIYCGDILLDTCRGQVYMIGRIFPMERHMFFASRVAFNYDAGKMIHVDVDCTTDDDWVSWSETYRIIGNIFENKEFLYLKKEFYR